MAHDKPFQSETITGTGRLGDNPKKFSGDNAKFTAVSLRVASASRSLDRDGNPIDRTTWRNLKVFGYQADNALKTLHKGDKIHYRGRLSPTEYKNRDGDLVEGMDIIIDDISLALDSAPGGGFDDDSRGSSRGGGRSSRSEGGSRSRSRSRRNEEPEDQDIEDFEDDSLEDDFEDEQPKRRRSARSNSGGRSRSRSRSARVDDGDIDDDLYEDNLM